MIINIIVYIICFIVCLATSLVLAVKESKSICPDYFAIGAIFVIGLIPFANVIACTICIISAIPQIIEMIGNVLVFLVSK